MMTGLSMIIEREKVIPKAARFGSGSGRRATTAASIGCSTAISNHIAARGSQNQKIRPALRGTFSSTP
jgi:hypothetical protein